MVESKQDSKITKILEVLKSSGWTELNDIYRRTSLRRTELVFILYILEREGIITYNKGKELIKIKEKGRKYLKLPKNFKDIIKGGEKIDQREKQE